MILTSMLATTVLAGCTSTPQYKPEPAPAPVEPQIRTYRGGLETRATWSTPDREYGTPHSRIEFELGSDTGQSRHFGFKGIIINGVNHDYGTNIYPEKDELNFILKPDTNERIIFTEASLNGDGVHPATARSEIDVLYVFSPVIGTDGKPATQFTYSLDDPIHGKKAQFNRPDLKGEARGIWHDNNETIVMPDLMPTKIDGRGFYTPFANDGDPSKSTFYLIPTEGTDVGAQRPTGEVFLRTTKWIYRGTMMSVVDYNKREETQRLQREAEAQRQQLQSTSPGIGLVK